MCGNNPGWAGVLSVSLAEAVPARVQAKQVEAGKGGQEETSLRNIWFRSPQVSSVTDL
jgi:hypothetical protein